MMNTNFARLCRIAFLAPVVALASACVSTSGNSVSEREFAEIEGALLEHVEVLASDEFEGRRPGTRGEELTLSYLQNELEEIGFVSGTNDPGNFWRAPVPLVSITPVDSRIKFTKSGRFITLPPEQSVAFSTTRRALVGEADMVFVGYAREEISPDLLKGKVALMLSEPGRSPARRATLLANGAVSVITSVATEGTVAQIRQALAAERFQLESQFEDSLVGFVSSDALADAIGEQRWSTLLERAQSDAFEPVELNLKATVEASSVRRDIRSANLIARLPGSNPDAGAILMLGHWDHFGVCRSEAEPDRLCNGAIDNASGMAVIIELSRRLASRGQLERDIYVLGTTAEEWGLLGTVAFVENPPIDLTNIVAAFNFDTVALAGRGEPVGFIGEGESQLSDTIVTMIEESGRTVGDRELAAQFIRRQDGWILTQAGVPTAMLSSAFGREEILMGYLSGVYHQPTDEVEGIILSGAVEDLLLHETLIRHIADSDKYP